MFSKAIKREFEVAFSPNAQPVGFRIVKYIVLGVFIYFFWGHILFWPILSIAFALSLTLHFWYRIKTEAWTRSYGGWDYEKNKSKLDP